MDTDDAPNGGNGTERDGRASGRRADKRGHREGSISRRPDGRWHGRLMVGFTPEGKPDRRHVYGRTRAEVQRKLNELRRRLEPGPPGRPGLGRETLGDFLARWLEASRRTLRPGTWQRYEELVRLHLVPALGRTRLDALRPDALQRLLAARLESGLSPRTVRHVHRVLHTALSQAVRWRYAARQRRPTPSIRPPSREAEITPPARRRSSPGCWTRRTPPATGWPPCGPWRCTPAAARASSSACAGATSTWTRGTLAVRRNLVGARRGVPRFGRAEDEPEPAHRHAPAGSRRRAPRPAGGARAGAPAVGARLRRLRPGLRLPPGHAARWPATCIRSFKAALARAGLPGRYRVHDLRHAVGHADAGGGRPPQGRLGAPGPQHRGHDARPLHPQRRGPRRRRRARIQRAVRGPQPPEGGTAGTQTDEPPADEPSGATEPEDTP